jgi:hypothetical protein
MTTTITPRYKLLVTYDIKPNEDSPYFQFVLNIFVPRLQQMGLYMWRAYHTAYGDYPVRQLEFLAEDLDTVHKAIDSDEYTELTERLNDYVVNYATKLVAFRDGFQF